MSSSLKSRFFGLGRSDRKRLKQRTVSSKRRNRRVQMESLEDRRLLALIGVDVQPPFIFANNTGSVNYTSSSDLFSADATPLSFQPAGGGSPLPIFPASVETPPLNFQLNLVVDENGDLLSGVVGDDFTVTGRIFVGVDVYDGVLLTGEVLDFGFENGIPGTPGGTDPGDRYDLRLEVTGGLLASDFFTGSDIGLEIFSEPSTFDGSFENDFTGGNKSTFGPIDKIVQQDPAQLGNYVWVDTNYDGIQNDGNTGVNGVTVDLYIDVDGDGIAEPGGDDGAPVATTVTADAGTTPGFYLFPNLDPDDYFVVFDPTTLPPGFEFTIQDAGGDDAADSDADQVTGIAAVTTLEPAESDLTWDAGIVQIINPGIEIIKYVDKVVETSVMHVLDFDELHKGDIVSTQYAGVTIKGVNNRTGAQNAAMVFDSANPSGQDSDLGTPNQQYAGPGVGSGGASNDTALGNVLIISEDLDASDPDDEAHGGVFTFTFDDPVAINHIDLLDIDSNESGGSVVTVTTPSGQQTFNIATAGNNSYQRLLIDVADVTELEVNFVSSGAITELKYTKTVEEKQWFDANLPEEAVHFNLGEEVEFSYHVTNTGDVALADVTVGDDNAGGIPFNPDPVLASGTMFNIGDLDQDGLLDPADGNTPAEEWIYTATITATIVGCFTNIGDVVGTPVNDDGDVIADDVVDDDPANYKVDGTPDIDIEKFTNGHQADDAVDAVEIAPGETVTWTYEVTNIGTAPIPGTDIVVTDDSGTPGDQSDDITPTPVLTGGTIFNVGDLNQDGILNQAVGATPAETWIYEASDIAQTLTSSGATSVFEFSGNSSLSGSAGNVRSFTTDGVSVNASAFSRTSGGTWAEGYLGLFGSGLGVTDTNEGNGSNGTHRVDNIGRDNYVLFEFDQSVAVDRAFLDSVVSDSDLSIWIGTIDGAFDNHQVLSDALLANLGFNEVNDTNSSSSRWADFNSGQVSGNVLVLAASVVDTSPEDQFKIRKVKFQQLVSGIYGNIGTVVIPDASDEDPSHYKNPAPEPPGIPNIDIEKLTNGVQADDPAQAVEIAPGEEVTWTYQVTNTGETSFAFAEVIVVDDNGTPGNTGDDFSPDSFVGPDVGNDGLLSPGEVWTYTHTETAEALTTSGASGTFVFDGNSGQDGSNGNQRTFTANGISVNTTAFSRDSNGVWGNAFLGIYSGGLGVTDSSEGNGSGGTHRVDNIGRTNYVLFEFSENVVVDQAFLDSVVNDSDLSIWIGTIDGAFNNHQTLSDALLNGLALNEVNNTTSGSSRWADFNGGEVSGNVLVLAASTADATPEDNFKIRKVSFQQQEAGVYGNVGSVVAGEVGDSDPSHYKNPIAAPSGKIGDYVWNDADRDGKQDHDEAGVANVTVNLLNADGQQVATTTTNGDGLYSFTGLAAGSYIVEFVAPSDFVISPQDRGTDGEKDSDANPYSGRTDLIHLDAHECDNSIDAGMYEAAVDFMFEAEDYEWIDSPWRVYNSSSASGGQFIKAPNGTGSHYNSPPSHKKVMYQFDVDHSGNYEVSGLVRASNSANNSVWIKIDNQPWVQWHMDVTGSSFQWQNVTDGWDQDTTSFHLDSGHHTMQLKVREDGTKLDKFMFSKLGTSTTVIDVAAQVAASNQELGNWIVEWDDDGNEFLTAATGTHYRHVSDDADDLLSLNFEVSQNGTYQMHALVSALNSGDNSFWVRIDGGAWIQWHLTVTNGEFVWQTVTDGSGHEAVTFDLDAGAHVLDIQIREDGTSIDKVVITNDDGIDLNAIG